MKVRMEEEKSKAYLLKSIKEKRTYWFSGQEIQREVFTFVSSRKAS